jgi:Sec-independent protein translocase protein TatA
MPAAPLALFGDLGVQELLLVAVAAVMIFGKRLPEVAGQAFAHFQKLRRTLSQMWRETGIDDELRRIQRDLDRDESKKRRLSAPPPKPPKPPKPPEDSVPREPAKPEAEAPVEAAATDEPGAPTEPEASSEPEQRPTADSKREG